VSASASPRRAAPVEEHRRFVKERAKHSVASLHEPETESVYSFQSIEPDRLRTTAQILETAERLRGTLPVETIRVEAEQLEEELKAKRSARDEKLAVARKAQEEIRATKDRCWELKRKLKESKKIAKGLEQETSQKSARLQLLMNQKQVGKMQVDHEVAKLAEIQKRRIRLQADVEHRQAEAEQEALSLPSEPSADEAVGALRRELRRLEATRSKHEALDLEERSLTRQEADRTAEPAEEPQLEDDIDAEPSSRILAAHESKVASLRSIEWQLRTARVAAAAIAA
jgi:uncharacterized small protein (DUF1192 family)